jgi:hypothetical protein
MGTSGGSSDVSMVPPESEFPTQQPAIPSKEGTLAGREVKERTAGDLTPVIPLPSSDQSTEPPTSLAKKKAQTRYGDS